MENENISSRNLRSLLILIVMCGSLINGAFTVAQDTWIAVLLMGVLFFPVIIMYSRICVLFPGENFYDIMIKLFGGLGSFIIIFLMSAYALVVTGLQLRNFAEFTLVIALQNTPPIPIMIVLILPVLYLAQAGIEVLGRWSLIVCAIIIINISFTFLFSFNIIDPSHILPIMDHSLVDIASNSFALGSIAVGDTVMVLAIMGNLKKGESPYRAYFLGIGAGVCLFTLVTLRNLFILGPDMEQAAKFSTYLAVRIIDIGNFLERIESSISFVYILMGTTKMALLLMASSMGFARLLKAPNYKRLLLPVSLLVLIAGTVAFKNVFEMYEFAWQYRYFALPFQIGIPLLVWITAEIKTHLVSIKSYHES